MDCQAILPINENQEGPKTGVCTIRAHDDKDGDSMCRSEGRMQRRYDLGLRTGTTPFVASIYIEQGKAGRIHGSAHWPEMTYMLP